MASDPDQEYIIFIARKRFLLPVTYFSPNTVYPFTLRLTDINAQYQNFTIFSVHVIFFRYKELNLFQYMD